MPSWSFPTFSLSDDGFYIFSCCAASRFIKFTIREKGWLFSFPQRPPRRKGSFSRTTPSCNLGNYRGFSPCGWNRRASTALLHHQPAHSTTLLLGSSQGSALPQLWGGNGFSLSQVRGFNSAHHRPLHMLHATPRWNSIKSTQILQARRKEKNLHTREKRGVGGSGDFSFGTYCLLNSAICTISMFVITRKFSIKCKKPETSKSILSFDCFIDWNGCLSCNHWTMKSNPS